MGRLGQVDGQGVPTGGEREADKPLVPPLYTFSHRWLGSRNVLLLLGLLLLP